MPKWTYIWPEVFTNPDFEYPDDPKHPKHVIARACADGLEGWGLCAVDRRPETFGEGMVKVGIAAGCSCVAEALKARATEIGF